MTRPCNLQPRLFSPVDKLCAFGFSGVDVGNDLAHMVRANQSADVGFWVHRIADIQLRGSLGKSLEKCIQIELWTKTRVAFVQISPWV